MSEATRVQNFDAIRIVAAASVIFSHAFLIADGHERNEPLVQLLGKGNILGIYGVFVFLIVSGFLVTHSFQTSPSLGAYFWKRFLRIYPGLALCAVVSAFVIAPFFAVGAVDVGQHAAYVRDVLAMQEVWFIPGVSFYGEESVINGSLWTIRQELACYVILAFLGMCGSRGPSVVLTGLVATSIANTFDMLPPSRFFGELLYCLPAFLGGVLMYFLHKRFGRSRLIALLCCAGLVLAGYFGLLRAAFPFFGSYIIVFLGFSQAIHFGNVTRFGDLSYGTYLYGWPVEEIVRSLLGDRASWSAVFVISLPIALGCGWVSWHLIEKHALGLKHLRPWRVATGGAMN